MEGSFSPADPVTPTGEPYREWTFDGQAGESITVQVRTDGFAPVVGVRSPKAGLLAQVTSEGEPQARVQALLGESGAHTIRVAARDIGAEGSFSVTLERAAPAAHVERIRYGQEVRVTLAGTPREYGLDAAAGDAARIWARSDAFPASARVLDADGREIAAFGDQETEVRFEREGTCRIAVAGGTGEASLRVRFAGGEMLVPLDVSEFPVVEESSADATRREGATVRLQDGTSVEIPAGALPEDRTVRVRRVRTPGPEGEYMVLTDIDVGGGRLARPAVVRIPVPELPEELAALPHEWQAFRFHDGRMTRVPSVYDAESRTLTAESDQFSLFAAIGIAFLIDLLAYGIETIPATLPEFYRVVERNPVAPLAVPYYHQNMSMWCLPTSSQMLMAAHGVIDTENWNLAAERGVGFRTPLRSLLLHGMGRFAPMFSSRGLTLQYSRIPWRNAYLLALNVVWNLRQGRPVLLDMNSVAHAVVAVGFDNACIYVHDSSGSLAEFAAPTRAPLWESQWRLAAIPIPWPNFLHACEAGNGNVWSATVANRRVTGNSVSVQLQPRGLRFSHPGPTPYRNQSSVFQFGWNGFQAPGFRLCYNCAANEEIFGNHAHPSPPYATNSSRFDLEVEMSNTGTAAAVAQITVTLGGTRLAGPLAAALTQEPIEPFVIGRSFDVVRDQPLCPTPLVPGIHDMVIEATVGGAVVDRITLPLEIGPSQVAGARLDPRGEETYLAWNANCEPNIEYLVMRIRGSATNEPTFVTATTRTEHLLPRLRPEDPPEWYFVHARHVPSQLFGPASDVVPAGSPPEVEITSPRAGDEVTERVITVTGTVRGTQNGLPGGQPIDRVILFGNSTPYPATVSNGQFSQQVLMRRGENALTARAVNRVGVREATVTVQANIEQTILTIEMTWFWNGNDVDLHVTDPGGRVTGYSDPISPGSRVDGRQLDIDDTSGPGTETYTMTAEVYGDYQVRVNYYRGDAPQVVLVRWVAHEGTPREQSGQRTVSLGREDHNRGEGGANETFAIPVPAP